MSTPIPAALDRGVFGWNGVRIAEHYTAQECAIAITQIMDDPANANPAHAAGKSIELYTAGARKRMDALSWAIFYHKQDAARVARVVTP